MPFRSSARPAVPSCSSRPSCAPPIARTASRLRSSNCRPLRTGRRRPSPWRLRSRATAPSPASPSGSPRALCRPSQNRLPLRSSFQARGGETCARPPRSPGSRSSGRLCRPRQALPRRGARPGRRASAGDGPLLQAARRARGAHRIRCLGGAHRADRVPGRRKPSSMNRGDTTSRSSKNSGRREMSACRPGQPKRIKTPRRAVWAASIEPCLNRWGALGWP